jgi:hypothetical protein
MATNLPDPGAPATATRAGSGAPRWRRSSFSTGADATCVDVAIPDAVPHPGADPTTRDPTTGDPAVLVRNSTDPGGPMLRFTFAEWRVFLLGVRAGEFELPGRHTLDAGHDSSARRAASSS